ncbi:MAG: lipoprotein insertase outer membrane protein LolB [Proteobacteria bacterium]|nr:lipoprotein insertase outer membrane protein LolB [Pseudomonadota bacterium]MCL2309514.1 lipoprotein insertase outer membrane protein LolB [Pseudomonadota bacterium]
MKAGIRDQKSEAGASGIRKASLRTQRNNPGSWRSVVGWDGTKRNPGFKPWATLCLTMLTALLVGCAGLPHGDDNASYTAATADVPFHAQGRFSARYEDKALAARFDWRHTPGEDMDEIELISPLGATVASLTRVGDTMTVQQGDHPPRTQQSADWEDSTAQVFGFPLPVKSLAYWLRGVPAPGAAAVTRDAVGHFDSLRQQGWTVQYSYAAEVNGPERIDIHYGDTVGVRLKIDRFLLLENKP